MNNEITAKDIIKAIDEIDDIFSEERKEENENFWRGYKYAITRIQDYITNLQEINNNLKEDFKRHIDRINELEERIDKAVEYIKEHTFQEEIGFDNKKGKIHYGYFVECKAKNLLNILNGRSDE